MVSFIVGLFGFTKRQKQQAYLPIYIFFLSSPFSVCNKMMKHTINYMSIFTPFFSTVYDNVLTLEIQQMLTFDYILQIHVYKYIFASIIFQQETICKWIINEETLRK